VEANRPLKKIILVMDMTLDGVVESPENGRFDYLIAHFEVLR
jgi:hypothetical protein